MRWLSAFLKEFDIGNRERTAIELRTLCRVLWLNGTYDQCNGPALASIEEVSRRISQLIEAYASAGASKTPNWSGVKHFTSTHSAGTVVPVALRTFAFRKVKEEVEAENLRLRASNALPSGPLAGDDAVAALPGATSPP